jgi:hypothetical protein
MSLNQEHDTKYECKDVHGGKDVSKLIIHEGGL